MDRIGRDCRDRTDDIHLHPRATTIMPPLAFRVPWLIEPSVWQARFAADSPLERTGFEPSVPREAPGIPVVSALVRSGFSACMSRHRKLGRVTWDRWFESGSLQRCVSQD